MPAYPSIPFTYESTGPKDSGIKLDVSTSGKAATRRYFDGAPITFKLVHVVDTTDKDALEADFATNAGNTITVTWEGSSYDCLYIDAPQTGQIGPDDWKVINMLREIGP